jgi:hypothetical protein
MVKFISNSEERSLRELLCLEAAETRPAYSQTLHRQILSAIERMPAEDRLAPEDADVLGLPTFFDGLNEHQGSERRWLRRVAGLCAAACLLMAFVVGWQLKHPIGGNDIADTMVAKNVPPKTAEPTVEVSQEDLTAMEKALAGNDMSVSVSARDAAMIDSQLSQLAGVTTVAGLSAFDDVIGGAVEDLSDLLLSASFMSQSAELKHDTRLAAESLLLRLPVGVEFVSKM